MPKLIIKKDDLLIKKLSVPEDILAFTVGSNQGNDIIIEDDSISMFHMQFEKQEDEYFVHDLRSQWGTYVNGEKITRRTVIKNNDEIGIGNYTIIFINPKSDFAPSLMDKGSEMEELVLNQKIEDKIAGVPTLMQLNSWLNKEQESFEKEGDFFVENNEKSDIDSDLEFETETILQKEIFATPKLDVEDSSLVDSNFDKKTEKVETNYYLIGIYGPYFGKKFKLKYPVTKIGRDRKLNDIVIRKNAKGKTDQSISRRHATITYKNNLFYVTDKRSKSRTYVNQKKLDIHDEVLLKPGDELEIVSDQKSHIFRLVREGDWDFSFPKKAGQWYIRFRTAFLNITSASLIVIAIFLLIASFKTSRLITKKPKSLKVKEEIWFLDELNSNFNGSVNTSNLYGFGVADINGDRFVDLVFYDEKGYLKSVNGKTKKIFWSNYDFQVSPSVPITLDDLNNNGIPDVIVVSKDLRLRALDGKWGIEIWKSPILAGPLSGPPVVGDFNSDGLKDIAITSMENAVYIGYSSLKNYRWIKLDCEEPLRSIASAEYLKGDGNLNIFIGTETGKIVVIDGIYQKFVGEININEEFNKAVGTFDQDNQVRYPVAFGDLNGDQTPDLIISTVQGNILALNGETFERFWYDVTESNSQFDQSLGPFISMGDLDGDRRLDVVILTSTGTVRALKGMGQGKDRKIVLWEFPKTENSKLVGTSPILADFNKNGTVDVLAFDNSGKIYIFEGSTGKILWKSAMEDLTLLALPLIADLDNDNYLDILALRADGNFYKLSTNRLIMSNAIVWDQMYSNSRHTNTSLYLEPGATKYHLYMAISILIISGVIGLNIFLKKRRKILAKS